MAAKLTLNFGEATRKDIIAIDPRNITPSRVNGRKFGVSKDDIKRLAADMSANGQINPIQITRFEDTPEGMYEAVSGNTRLLAAQYLVQSGTPFKIKCEIVKGMTPDTAFIANVRENAMRNEVSLVDMAANIERMIHVLNMSTKEVAEITQRSEAWVSQTLKINELGEKERRLIHNNILSQSAAWQLFDLSPEERAEVLASAPVEKQKDGKEKITSTAVAAAKRAIVERKAESGEATRATAAPRKIKEVRAFFEVIASTDYHFPEGTHEAMSALAKDFLKWLDGRLKDDTMYAKLEALIYDDGGNLWRELAGCGE